MLALIALSIAAIFTGVAFYINFAEHPARMTLAPAQALAQWKPAYKRGFLMQATLAVAGFVFAAASWRMEGAMLTLAGGLLLLANWPFTLAFIMPVNNKLLDMHADSDPAAISDLLIRWNRLHAVRTLLGAAAMVLLIIAIAS